MANLIERLTTALSPARYATMERRALERDTMRAEQPWLWERADTFTELDDRMIDMIRRLKDWEVVYGQLPLTSIALSEEDRLDIVQRSRIYSAVDPLIAHAIELWTSYGFGQQIQVQASDERAQEAWDQFWDANERIFGDRDIHEMSDNLLTDGEIWLACYVERASGDLTVRVWPTEQITDIVTVSGDHTVPLYYKRTWRDGLGEHIRYYPDYQADPDDLKSAVLPSGAEIASETDDLVCTIMPIQFKRLGAVGSGWLRGWPLTTGALDWAQAYRQFCQDRAAVARKIASEVETFKAKGGQRGIEAMAALRRSSMQGGTSYSESNPPAGAGSELWINDAIERTRMNMSTGAQDAATDSMLLIGQVATALGLPAFMLGRTDMLQNRATADTAMKPTLRVWNSYQLLWIDVFSDLFNMVLDAREQVPGIRQVFAERGVTVELDSPLDVDFEQMVNSIIEFWDRGIVEPIVLTRQALSLPENGRSPETVESIVAHMYPEAAMEADRALVNSAIVAAIEEGRTLDLEDVGRLLEDAHEH